MLRIVTRPPGWAFAPPLGLPDLFCLMDATSNVGRSFEVGADGACAAAEPASRTMTIPRSSIHMSKNPGTPDLFQARPERPE